MRTHPYDPDYYLYKKEGRWFKTDDRLTKQISAHIFAREASELPKIVFYPNWDAKGCESEKYVAWRVNSFGEQVVRWYWKGCEHSKNCAICTPLGSGRCAKKAIALLEWNKSGSCWSLAEMEGKVSKEEEKVLDS